MLFSIVLRVYNAEKYLETCIDSVLKQTYSNFELIIVDDGSSDASPYICDKYAEKYARIKVCHQENKGGVGAYLSGFKLVTGDYVFSLDADDWYEPNLLEICNSELKENNSDMIIFSLRNVYENRSEDVVIKKENSQLFGNDIIEFILSSTAHGLCMKGIRKKCLSYTDYELNYLNENGRKFKFNNDVAVGVPLLNNVKSCVIVDDILYNYRILLDSASHSYDPIKTCEVCLYEYDFLYNSFLIRDNLTDSIEKLVIWESTRKLIPIFRHFIVHFVKYSSTIKRIMCDRKFGELLKNNKVKNELFKYDVTYRLSFNIFKFFHSLLTVKSCF